MTRSPHPQLTDEERTCLERLRWITLLHWTAGTVLGGVMVIYAFLAPMPDKLLRIMTMLAIVYVYVGVAEGAIRWWHRTRAVPMGRFYRVTMNALAVADIVVLVVGIHFGGGPDAPGLNFCIIPMVVYGGFLPRRDAYAHLGLAVTMLASVFAGEHAGWLPHSCPPLPGNACAAASLPLAVTRYLSVAFLAFLATYLTSFIGNHLRKQEAYARRLAEERGQLAELRSRFVTMASHEFRTPLAVILAASDALKRYGARMTAAQREQRLDKIGGSVRHMTALLEDLLTIGQVDAEKLCCVPEAVDLDALCGEIIGAVGAATPRTHRLLFSGTGSPVPLLLDARLMRQILSNLLLNAVKYSPEGSRVTLEATRHEASVVLRVTDEGIGITPEDQTRLFETFQRGSNVGTIPGSGLGLAITKKAVVLHGGTITVESTPGRGSIFTVTLPAETMAGSAEGSTAASG